MNLISILMMAMTLSAKYLFAVLMFCLVIFFAIGIVFRQSQRLDYLFLGSGALFAFGISFWVLLKEAANLADIMFPKTRPITSWDGFVLFVVIGICFILVVPISFSIFESIRAFAIGYFKSNDYKVAGRYAGEVYSKSFSRFLDTMSRIRRLDFGGRYD